MALIAIPARYASTRFPGKPLVSIAGKTLIQRVVERAGESRLATAVYVATDDSRIHDHVVSFGGKAVMTASELRTGTDRLAAALGEIERREEMSIAHVVNLQGDEPLIDIAAVDRIIQTLRSEPIDAVTLCCPIRTAEEFSDRHVVKVVMDRQANALYFSRSPIPFDAIAQARKHVGVYGFQTSTLRAFARLEPTPLEQAESLEQLRLLQNGFTIRVLETGQPQIGVDSPEDVARVEDALARQS